jgi:hypothetical protein
MTSPNVKNSTIMDYLSDSEVNETSNNELKGIIMLRMIMK